MPGPSQRVRRSPTVRTVAETLAVGDEEVEAVVIASIGRELCQIRCRAVVAGNEVGYQGTARAGMGGVVCRPHDSWSGRRSAARG
jgi:hypothetical protein